MIQMEMEIISQYTAMDAVEDGLLVDAYQLPDGAGEITAELWGEAPVYLTRELYSLIEKGVDHPRWCNDWRGVWWDIVHMARTYGAIRGAAEEADRSGQGWGSFPVIITGTGRRRTHHLKLSINAEGLTFMLRGED